MRVRVLGWVGALPWILTLRVRVAVLVQHLAAAAVGGMQSVETIPSQTLLPHRQPPNPIQAHTAIAACCKNCGMLQHAASSGGRTDPQIAAARLPQSRARTAWRMHERQQRQRMNRRCRGGSWQAGPRPWRHKRVTRGPHHFHDGKLPNRKPRMSRMSPPLPNSGYWYTRFGSVDGVAPSPNPKPRNRGPPKSNPSLKCQDSLSHRPATETRKLNRGPGPGPRATRACHVMSCEPVTLCHASTTQYGDYHSKTHPKTYTQNHSEQSP